MYYASSVQDKNNNLFKIEKKRILRYFYVGLLRKSATE